MSDVKYSATDDADFEVLWRRFRTVAGAVVLVVLAGAMTLTHRWALDSHRGATLSALRPENLPQDHLTGVGATVARFRATHGNPLGNQKFGPLIQDVRTGDAVPTYDLANSTNPSLVDTLVHSFPARTSQAAVLATVRAHDIPADARPMRTASPESSCRIFVYRSAAIAGSGPYTDFGDGTVTVALSSRIGMPYSAVDVRQAYETVGPLVSTASC